MSYWVYSATIGAGIAGCLLGGRGQWMTA